MFCDQCHAQMEEAQPFCDKCGADRPTSGWGPDLLLGTVVANRYRLEERLGSGGMGYVYRAKHTDLGTDFAVKFLHRDLTTPVHKKRFTREARVAASLRNPHAVQVVDFGELPDDDLYLVMEYVPGHNLSDWVDNYGHPSTAFVVTMIRHVAMALEEAHEQGTVHRDIKPENILITPTKRGVHVKLTDFGIASLIESDQAERLTRTGMVHGSPGYMSPEQASGSRDLDGRADLYALGVIAWELLADRPMFEAATPMALIVKHIHEAPISLRVHRPPPELPEALYGVIERLVRKEPEQRTPSAERLLAELVDVPIDPTLIRVPLFAKEPDEPVDVPYEIDENWNRTTERSAPNMRQSGAQLNATIPHKRMPSNVGKAQPLFSQAVDRNPLGPPTRELEKLGSTPYGYEPVGSPKTGESEDDQPRFEVTERVDPLPASVPNPTHEAPAMAPPTAPAAAPLPESPAKLPLPKISVQPAPVAKPAARKSNAFRKPTLSEEFPLEPLPDPPRHGMKLVLVALLVVAGLVLWVFHGGGFDKLWLHPDAQAAKAEKKAEEPAEKPASAADKGPAEDKAPESGDENAEAAPGVMKGEGAGVQVEVRPEPISPEVGVPAVVHFTVKRGEATLAIRGLEIATSSVQTKARGPAAEGVSNDNDGRHGSHAELVFDQPGGYQMEFHAVFDDGENVLSLVARCPICVGGDGAACGEKAAGCTVEESKR